MNAIVYERYGPPEVLQWKAVPDPVPGDHEVLIEVHATSATIGDARVRSMNLPGGFAVVGRLALGITGPRKQILGTELSGVVAAVGKAVTRFKPGDAVLGMTGTRLGAYAEYCVVPEDGPLALKPAGVTFEQAATVCFGGTTALDYFRRGRLVAGERLLVNGASGAVGTAAVQLGKHLGAHVTGVCSAANAELVRSLGADVVIDYATQDFTQNGERYDLVMDNVGNAPYARSKGSLNPGGRFLMVVGSFTETIGAAWLNLTGDHRVVAGLPTVRAEDVGELAGLVEKGAYRVVIDKTFPLAEAAAAHALVDTGHKKGNIALVVRPAA